MWQLTLRLDDADPFATACDGEQRLCAARNVQPELIILHIMLPKINAYEICRLIHKDGLEMPIIILTAKGQE